MTAIRTVGIVAALAMSWGMVAMAQSVNGYPYYTGFANSTDGGSYSNTFNPDPFSHSLPLGMDANGNTEQASFSAGIGGLSTVGSMTRVDVVAFPLTPWVQSKLMLAAAIGMPSTFQPIPMDPPCSSPCCFTDPLRALGSRTWAPSLTSSTVPAGGAWCAVASKTSSPLATRCPCPCIRASIPSAILMCSFLPVPH